MERERTRVSCLRGGELDDDGEPLGNDNIRPWGVDV